MIEVKKTIKTDMILKNARVIDGNIVDENGEIISLPESIAKIYGEDTEFKLSLSKSISEDIDIDDVEDNEDNDYD